MSEATAWLLNFQNGLCASVGEREMMHLVESPVLSDIPHTPDHCRQILIWQEEVLPVMDLMAWLTGQPTDQAQASVGIVAWQDQPDEPPQYGALLFSGIPQKIRVTDDQFCDLPTDPVGWPAVSISCFSARGSTDPHLGPASHLLVGVDRSPRRTVAWIAARFPGRRDHFPLDSNDYFLSNITSSKP